MEIVFNGPLTMIKSFVGQNVLTFRDESDVSQTTTHFGNVPLYSDSLLSRSESGVEVPLAYCPTTVCLFRQY